MFNRLIRCALLGALASTALTGVVSAQSQAPTYEALDPRGDLPPITRIPLSERLPDLSGKRVIVINSWEGGRGGFNPIVQEIEKQLKQRFPGATLTVTDRNVRYSEDDPALWSRVKAEADAFIYTGAPSSSTTSYAFKWSAKLESMGIPGTVLMYDTLKTVQESTNMREGADVRFTAMNYPVSTISDAERARLAAASIDNLLKPLTASEKRTGVVPPPSRPAVAVTGTLEEIQQHFQKNGWTDGLPVIPPTEVAVAAMLKGTSHSPDEVVAEAFVPEGLKVTVRQVAINAVMAGCEPSHMPVLLAAIEAVGVNNLNSMLRSTNSFALAQVVNGPIRNEIGMNSGVNVLGPGNAANASIGRALRMFITNLGGGQPGLNIMAVVGQNANYSFALAENEEESPWTSLAESKGFGKNESTLTLFSGGWAHSGNFSEGMGLTDVGQDMARYQIRGGALLIVSPKRAEMLKREGLDRKGVMEAVWKAAARPLSDLPQRMRESSEFRGKPENTLVPMFPENSIEVVVAGGDGAPMMQAWSFYRPVTVSIDKWR